MPHTIVAVAFAFVVAVSGVVNGQMAFDTVTWIEPERPQNVSSTADLNHDGIPDLCASFAGAQNGGTPQWRAYLGVGDGAFQPPIVVPTGNTTIPGPVEICDFDNDGTLDAILGFQNKLKFWIQDGNGDGTFANPTEIPLTTVLGGFLSVDVNMDGWVDLLSVGNSRLYAVLNDGAGGVYLHIKSWGNGNFTVGMTVVDFDNDGFRDVVFNDATATSSPNYARFRNMGVGTFLPIQPKFPSSPYARKVASDDVDKDRRGDLIFENGDAKKITLIRGLGNMAFDGAVNFDAGIQTLTLTIADVNGDGASDVAVGGTPDAKALAVIPGDGLGHFGAPQVFPLPAGVFTLTAADLNLDGRCDLVSTSGPGNSINISFNSTNGHPVSSPIGSGTPSCRGIMTMGLAQPASLESASATLTCTNAPASSWGVALVGTTVDPTGADSIGHDVEVYVDIFQSSWVAIGYGWASPSGTAGFPMKLPADPGSIGMQLCAQSFWNEPLTATCSTSVYGTSSSRGLTFQLEP